MTTHTSHTHVKAALAALLLGVITAIFIGKLPPAIPALRAEFGLSLKESGWLVSMFNTLGLVASIFMGLIAARLGAWRQCVLGLIAMLVGALLGAFTSSAMWMLASRFLEGVGSLSIVVAAPALLMLSTADVDRKRFFSFWGAYMPTGTALGMVMAPLLIAQWGWRSLWLATGACAVGGLLLILAFRGDYAQARANHGGPEVSWRASAGPLKRPGPWWIALAFACYAFNYYAIMVWMPTFMVGERHTPLATASLLTALMVAVNILGNIGGGALMQRGLSRGTIVSLAGVATIVTCALIFSATLPDWLRYLACVAFSMSVGILPGSVMSSAQTHATNPAQVGTIQGMINQGSNMGQFVSPLIVTAVVGVNLAWHNMLWLLLGTSTIIIVSGLIVRGIERRIDAAHMGKRAAA